MRHDSLALSRLTYGVVGSILFLSLAVPTQAQELPPEEESEQTPRSLEQDQATVPLTDTIPEATFEGGETFRSGGADPDTSTQKAAVDPEITVESPNGGATWKVGREETIEWTEQGVSGDVRIWLYRGDGELVRKIYRWSGSGPAPWTVPPYIEPGDDYYIVIFSHQNPDVRDRSDGTFTIEEGTGPYITTLSPDGGDKWAKGEEATIRWDSRNVEGEVFISLLKGETVRVKYITQATEDDGSYTWTVLEDLEPRTDYYVGVRSVENTSVWDTGGRFEIGYPNIDLIGNINTAGNAWDVDVAGDYAYVADEYGGLTVADVSNPNDPFEVSTLELPSQALTLDVEGNHAYVASAGGGLRVVDISSPFDPMEIGSFDTPDDAWGVTVSDNYAYVATEAAGLYILDVSDPENPFEVGHLDTPGAAVNVRVREDYAYVADLSGGLRIVDISDPANPTEVSVVSAQDEIWDVDLAGTYAYTADHGLRVIDVSEPANPAEVSSLNASDDAWDVSVSGSYAYLAADHAGVRTIDVASPASPEEVGYFDTPDPAYGISTAGDHAYVAAEEGGVYIIRNQSEEDVTPPAVPTGLSAAAGDQEVTLTWDPNTESDLAEYRLYRFVLPQQETEHVDDIPAGTETYTDTGLTPGREHSYWVTAVDEAGNESEFSEEATATPSSGPFADWPDQTDPSITLRIVQPDLRDIAKVELVREEESIVRPVESGFAEFPLDEPIGDSITEIRLLNQEDQVFGYLPFQYTQSNYEEPFGIDAVVYIHEESKLSPSPGDWSEEWEYYDDLPLALPLSMLVPPGGDVDEVDIGQKDPVVLVHGLSGSYPSWGGEIRKARKLTKHLDEEEYDGWQFYYPENQDITKSGPLLAKAIHRLRNNLGYGPDQSFDIVAHSMGGLVSRHYIQRMEIGSPRRTYSQVLNFDPGEPGSAVDRFLMLGTPNHGSYTGYRCTEGTGLCTFAEFLGLGFDQGAPAFRQMTPGSKFLSDLNRSSTAPEPYSPASTLVLAGTGNPNEAEEVGVEIVEIPNQDDGVVAVSSAGLLDLGLPLAVGDFAHTASLDLDCGWGGDCDPRLNEDTKGIITSFLSSSYTPEDPEYLGNGVTGFWQLSTQGEPLPLISPPEEVDTEEGILTINAEFASYSNPSNRLSVIECDPGTGYDGSACVRVGKGQGMKGVPGQRRYFSFSDKIDFGRPITREPSLGFKRATGLGVGTRSAPVQKSPDPGKGDSQIWRQVGEISLTTKSLQTTQATFEPSLEQQFVIDTGGFVPATETSSPSTSDKTSESTIRAENQTTEVQFQVDAKTDTLSFWLARGSTGDFSGHNMRLIAPDGNVIDSSDAKSESGLGYTQDVNVGYAIYLVENPTTGRWTVRHNASQDAVLSAPVKSSVNLRANAPDSTFVTGETVPVRVSFSGENTYEDKEMTAQLRIEDPEGGTTTLGAVGLDESDPATYEGEFSPSYVGSYHISVDFSAKVGDESVRRRTTETVEVTGDSTDTAPEPPAAPTDLSTQFNRSDGVTLNWSASGSGSVEEYRIYRDTIPTPTRQVATVSSGQTTYTDSEARRGRTYYYRVTAAGTEGVESVYTDASSIFAYPSSLPVQIERTFGDAEAEEDYRLVALPGQASSSLGETVSDDWRGFREEGTSEDQPYSRSECEGNCQFGPGEGFWLITDQSWEINQTVNTVPLTEAKTTQVDLQEGWNIIANPLGVEVAWNTVQAASGTNQPLWRWDGTWQQTQTFAAATSGEAYYFRSDSLSQLTVPYPVPEAVPQTKADTAESERQVLTLSAVRGDRRLSTIEAGVRPDAKEGLDAFDQYGPPGYFGEATLRLIQEENGDRRVLATEYAAPDDEGNAFDVVLRAQPDTVLNLQADGLENIPGGEAALVNQATGETHDLMQDREATIVPQAAETRYRLLVGRSSFVDRKRQDIKPEEVKLLANYPNPFRTGTTIEYALPKDADVRLAVYDVLGRQVAVLEEGRRESGFHRVRWNVGDRSLSSGLYFYRLRAGEKTKSGRMVLLR